MPAITMNKSISPPKSWNNFDTHYIEAMNSEWYSLIFDILDTINVTTVNFMRSKGMKSALLPITTSSISSPMGLGSDSLPVKINLFDVPTYLADSMQFMLEYGCRFSENGCYYLMPSFRGEETDARHLAQFFHSEAEIMGGLTDMINFVESYVKALAIGVLDENSERLAGHFSVDHIERVAKGEVGFPRVTLDEAIAALKDVPGAVRYDQLGFRTITHLGERALMDMHGGIVWLTHLDHLSVPFYQAFDPANPKAALCADLLMGIGETIGAGERHADVASLFKALDQHQVDKEPYAWYAEMRAMRPMQTSGFGLGTERFLCWLLGHDDVRDCQIVPRVNGLRIIP